MRLFLPRPAARVLHRFRNGVLALLAITLPGGLGAAAQLASPTGAGRAPAAADRARLLHAGFEPGPAGLAADVRFVLRGAQALVTVTDDAVLLSVGAGADPIRLALDRRTAGPPAGVNRLEGVVNRYPGNDPAAWSLSQPRYAAVRFPATDGGPALELAIGPDGVATVELDAAAGVGGDTAIDLPLFRVRDARRVSIASSGDLQLETANGSSIALSPPRVRIAGGSVERARFVLGGDGLTVRAAAAAPHGLRPDGREGPDPPGSSAGNGELAPAASPEAEVAIGAQAPAVVPTLRASTFLGGDSQDEATAVAIDSATGELVVAGSTRSTDFPTHLPRQPAIAGGYDAFVARFTADGTALVWATYLGGGAAEGARAVAVGPAGGCVVVGNTESSNFPVLAAAQPTRGGRFDAFATSLDAAGALVWSTYLGGGQDDYGRAVAVGPSGSVALAGDTRSSNFPVQGAVQNALAGNTASDAFVSQLSATGALVFSTYLGGNVFDGATGVAFDGPSGLAVAGYADSPNFPMVGAAQPVKGGLRDAFFARLEVAAARIAASTFLGGSGADQALGLTLDETGRAYVVGDTLSTNLPVVAALQAQSGGSRDGLLASYLPGTATLAFATYLGGSGVEQARAVAWTPVGGGQLLVAGFTDSTDFPTVEPLQVANAGFDDAFVARLSGDGSILIDATYLGGTGYDAASGVATDASGRAVVVGYTASADFPLALPLQPASGGSDDAFLSILDLPVCLLPGAVGNTLQLVKSDADVRFTWTDVADATGYQVVSGVDRTQVPATPLATAPSGSPGALATPPADPLVLFLVLAENACGSGPPGLQRLP